MDSHDDAMLGVVPPPFTRRFEDGLISAVLRRPALLRRLTLEADDFYILEHRLIWAAFRAIAARGELIDYASLLLELRALGREDAHVIVAGLGEGSPHVFAELPAGERYDLGPSAQPLEFAYYALKVRGASERRRLISAAALVAERAYDCFTPFDAVMAGALIASAERPRAVRPESPHGELTAPLDEILDI